MKIHLYGVGLLLKRRINDKSKLYPKFKKRSNNRLRNWL